MSAPVSRDPLVVNTKDGSCWVRRALASDGRGLYALEGTPRCCPEYVLASLTELAEIGLTSMAHVLPMPVGPQPSERERLRAAFVSALDTAHKTQPCSCGSEIWSSCCHAGAPSHGERRADAVLAVRDAEVEFLIGEVDRLSARVVELEQLLADAPVAVTLTKKPDPRACDACGSLPESWCPDCAACQQGCFGGFDGNNCSHSKASWGGGS